MANVSDEGLRVLATNIRAHALRMTSNANSSHIGTGLSMADILAVLYGAFLRYDARAPQFPDRDRFILSKGHGAAALYAALAESGFFPLSWLQSYCADGSKLAGHVSHRVPGVEFSTGSLGHGLSLAVGVALAAKRSRVSYRSVVLLSDGECDEGSIWEAALFAPHHRLENLIVIIDYNKIQSFGRIDEVLALEPFADKWKAFGWAVSEIDGHHIPAIRRALASVPMQPSRPSVLIAHTVKGKGVSFMEDRLAWHYKSASGDELVKALRELGVEP